MKIYTYNNNMSIIIIIKNVFFSHNTTDCTQYEYTLRYTQYMKQRSASCIIVHLLSPVLQCNNNAESMMITPVLESSVVFYLIHTVVKQYTTYTYSIIFVYLPLTSLFPPASSWNSYRSSGTRYPDDPFIGIISLFSRGFKYMHSVYSSNVRLPQSGCMDSIGISNPLG